MVEAMKELQYIGKAQAPVNIKKEQQVGASERRTSLEQKQFHERYVAELARAQTNEKAANQHARDRLKGLSAPELRRAGVKQVLWGWGLSFLNYIGAGVGALGGVGIFAGLGSLSMHVAAGSAISSALGIATAMSIAAPVVGAIGGAIGGAELAGYIYNKYIRKHDKDLLPINKSDKIIGGVLAPWGATPPMVAGIKNIFEGYNEMKSIQ